MADLAHLRSSLSTAGMISIPYFSSRDSNPRPLQKGFQLEACYSAHKIACGGAAAGPAYLRSSLSTVGRIGVPLSLSLETTNKLSYCVLETFSLPCLALKDIQFAMSPSQKVMRKVAKI